MMPNITRGARMQGLMSYLLIDEGRHNEHTDQRVVAGDADTWLWYGGRVLDASEVGELARDLDRARVVTGTSVTVLKKHGDAQSGVLLAERVEAHVWHCSLSLRSDDRHPSDEEWRAIAGEFVERMGFTEASGKAACKWVAVNHGLSSKGNPHIHIAVQLVREDGTKASTHNDFKRAQQIARELEEKYGLAITGDRSMELGTRGVSPAAKAAAERRSEHGMPDTVQLARTVRAAAASSADEAEFVRRCRQSGLLIRPRFARGRTDVVEGYSVALRPAEGDSIVWHGGGKVARDLTLPRLRADWPDTVESSLAAAHEWQAAYRGQRPAHPGREALEPQPEAWKQCGEELQHLRDRLAQVPVNDVAGWASIAREGAGVFAAWSQRTEPLPGPLAALSAELARTSQIRAHRVQPPPAKRPSAMSAAMLLAMAGTKSDRAQMMFVMRQLLHTAEAIHDMLAARGSALRAAEMAAVTERNVRLVTAGIRSSTPEAKPRDHSSFDARVALDDLHERGQRPASSDAQRPPQADVRRPPEAPDRAPDIER